MIYIKEYNIGYTCTKCLSTYCIQELQKIDNSGTLYCPKCNHNNKFYIELLKK